MFYFVFLVRVFRIVFFALIFWGVYALFFRRKK